MSDTAASPAGPQLAEARPEELCLHTRAQLGPARDDRKLLAEEAEGPLPARLSDPPRDTQHTSRPRDAGGNRGPARPRWRTYPAGAGVGGGAEQRAEQRQQRPRRAQRPARAARHGPGGARARLGTGGLGALRPRRRGCGCAAARKGKRDGERGKGKARRAAESVASSAGRPGAAPRGARPRVAVTGRRVAKTFLKKVCSLVFDLCDHLWRECDASCG